MMDEFSGFFSEIRIIKAKSSGPEIKKEFEFFDVRMLLRFLLNLRILPLRQQGTSVQN